MSDSVDMRAAHRVTNSMTARGRLRNTLRPIIAIAIVCAAPSLGLACTGSTMYQFKECIAPAGATEVWLPYQYEPGGGKTVCMPQKYMEFLTCVRELGIGDAAFTESRSRTTTLNVTATTATGGVSTASSAATGYSATALAGDPVVRARAQALRICARAFERSEDSIVALDAYEDYALCMAQLQYVTPVGGSKPAGASGSASGASSAGGAPGSVVVSTMLSSPAGDGASSSSPAAPGAAKAAPSGFPTTVTSSSSWTASSSWATTHSIDEAAVQDAKSLARAREAIVTACNIQLTHRLTAPGSKGSSYPSTVATPLPESVSVASAAPPVLVARDRSDLSVQCDGGHHGWTRLSSNVQLDITLTSTVTTSKSVASLCIVGPGKPPSPGDCRDAIHWKVGEHWNPSVGPGENELLVYTKDGVFSPGGVTDAMCTEGVKGRFAVWVEAIVEKRGPTIAPSAA